MKNIALIALLVVNLAFPHSLLAQNIPVPVGTYNYTYIQGTFCSKAQGGAPVPGLLVSLVHPELGRSVPVYTDNFGNFTMGNIPIMNTPYYLEVYWGQRLIYRNTVLIQGPLKLPKVCL